MFDNDLSTTAPDLDAMRRNVVEAPSTMVASNHADITFLCDQVQELGTAAKALGIKRIPDVDWSIVNGIMSGVRNAPSGQVLHHQRVHVLQVFDAYDRLTDAVNAAKRPAPEPAPSPEPEPLPEPPAE